LLFEVYKVAGNTGAALEHLEKYHHGEKEILSSETDQRIKSLIIQNQVHRMEQEQKIALQEKEIYRLKNIELAESNEKLKKINDEKNEFIGIVAHDLKNPLSGVIWASQKIRTASRGLDDDTINMFSYEIKLASEKMLNMVTELLDINAIETGNRKVNIAKFDPTLLARRVVEDYTEKCKEKNIDLKLVLEEVGDVELDRSALNQILDNLVSNAIKYSPKEKKIFLTVKDSADKIRFEIKDEGPGLTEDDKTRLFTKFAKLSASPTGEESSTGLGLYIVKKLANSMKGDVWCESTEGEGATFIVELPYSIVSSV